MAMIEIWRTLNGDFMAPNGIMTMAKDYRFIQFSDRQLVDAILKKIDSEDMYSVMSKDKFGTSKCLGIYAPNRLVEEQLCLFKEQAGPHRIGQRRRQRIKLRKEVQAFFEAIKQRYPRCPDIDAKRMARWTCKPCSDRVGKILGSRGVEEAAKAYVRHRLTTYDDLLSEATAKSSSPVFLANVRLKIRAQIKEQITSIIKSWESSAS